MTSRTKFSIPLTTKTNFCQQPNWAMLKISEEEEMRTQMCGGGESSSVERQQRREEARKGEGKEM